MIQFVPPKLTIPPQSGKPSSTQPDAPMLDPKRIYVFASTHIDVGCCSYYRILFTSQLLAQRYLGALFCDTRILFSYKELFPLLF